MKIDSGSRSAPSPDCGAPVPAPAPALGPAHAAGAPGAMHVPVGAAAAAPGTATVAAGAPVGAAGSAGSAGAAGGSLERARSHVLAHERARVAPTRATGLRWNAGAVGAESGGGGGDASSAPVPSTAGASPGAGAAAAASLAAAAASAEPSAAAAGAALLPAAGTGVVVGTGPAGPDASPATPPDPGTGPPGGPPGTIVVRAEEALIVILVLVLWVAAIALFFNRWGKIRMLEPYQPKYEAPHRGSCPLVDCAGAPGLQHRSFSKFNLTGCGVGGKEAGLYSSMPSPHNLLRPRQNSVFVGSSATMVTLPLNPPRKAKSAMDIQTLVLAECGPLPSGMADGSFDADGHVPDHLPDSNFSAAIAKIDTFKVTNV